MNIIYQTTITYIGENAREALDDHMLITFSEGAPEDIQDFCFIHSHGELSGALQPGAILDVDGYHYNITAVGDVAQQNLKELGHITVRFDGEDTAEYPGSVHVSGPTPQAIQTGSILKFIV